MPGEYESRRGYSGRLYEQDFFWSINAENPGYLRKLNNIKQPSQKESFDYYVNFKDALELAKKFQPIDKTDPSKEPVDPANPRAPLLRDLKEALVEQMDLSDDQADRLKLYTAVGSPLDKFHGVDAFVEYDGKIITLDITMRETEGEKKADVIITKELPAPDDPETEEEYLRRVEEIAASIRTAIKLKRKPGRPEIQRLYPPGQEAA